MKIAVASMFRDSQVWHKRPINQVNRYVDQMVAQTIGHKNLDFYFLEGNSQDDTYEALLKYARPRLNMRSLRHMDADYEYDSTRAHDDRIKSLSHLGNTLLDDIRLLAMPDEYDYILWIESDLIIDPTFVEDILGTVLYFKVSEKIRPIVAPIVMLGNMFYDTWGFRDLDGEQWTNREKPEESIDPMSSIGSCALIPFELDVNFGEGAFVELCRQAREKGHYIFADKSVVIHHPNKRVRNRWV